MKSPRPGPAAAWAPPGHSPNTTGTGYAGVLPDKITIYKRPLERLYGADREGLRQQIRRVVLHEVAHTSGSATNVSRRSGATRSAGCVNSSAVRKCPFAARSYFTHPTRASPHHSCQRERRSCTRGPRRQRRPRPLPHETRHHRGKRRPHRGSRSAALTTSGFPTSPDCETPLIQTHTPGHTHKAQSLSAFLRSAAANLSDRKGCSLLRARRRSFAEEFA
jgi:Zincin-like metallopeptidase